MKIALWYLIKRGFMMAETIQKPKFSEEVKDGYVSH